MSQALFRPHECFFLLPCTSLVGSASFRRFRHWSRPELLLSNPRPRSIDFRAGGQAGWLLSDCRGWERTDDARAMVKTRFCLQNTRVGRIGSWTDGRSRKGGFDPRSERVGGDSLAPVFVGHVWSGWDGGGGDIDPLRLRGRMGALKGGIRLQMRWRMPSFNAPLWKPGPTPAGQGQHRNHDTSASRSEEMVSAGTWPSRRFERRTMLARETDSKQWTKTKDWGRKGVPEHATGERTYPCQEVGR